MSMVCKKFSFSNVGNRSTFLGNIKESIDRAGSAGTSHGWYIDEYSIGDELYFHSLGEFGNQNLYYSMKCRVPSGDCCHLHVCCQTGYNSGNDYDNQPGRFSVESNGLPAAWNGLDHGDSSVANFLRTPTVSMHVFVCKQFVMVFWKDEVTLLSLPGTVYPVWRRMFFGAMDSFFPETEQYLNWHDQTIVKRHGWGSSPFMGAQKFQPYAQTWDWRVTPRPTTGLLYKQPFDSVAKNKEIFGSYNAGYNYTTRWASTINYWDEYYYYGGNGTAQSPYAFTSYDISSWRLIGDYTMSTRFNASIVKHILHRPIVFLYEWLAADQIYCYPIAYLPYQAVRMGGLLKGADVISFGVRNFTVFPTLRDDNTFGTAIEFIEG